MASFGGTITIQENPVTLWETYSKTLEYSEDTKGIGFSGLEFSHRAEDGYYRAAFDIHGPHDFMSAFMESALGRAVTINAPDGKIVWEGYIHEMEYDAGRVAYKIDMGDMSNAVWVRYRVRGAATTSRSAVASNADSIAKYGRKEFVLSGGELESTGIADGVASQYLALHEWPRPSPARIDPDKELAEYPTIRASCRGWFETLNWCVYNQTVSTDNQGASAQVANILADTDVAQFVATTKIEANATSVSKEYDADRRGGDIVRDIARLGDPSNNRWIAYMGTGRTFRFAQASPPTEAS